MKADVIVSHLDPRGTIVDRLILRGIRHEAYSWAVCEYDPIDRVADLVDGGVVGLVVGAEGGFGGCLLGVVNLA